jgi:hypothetical protein
MSELTLERVARRLEEVERRLNEKESSSAKDWRMAAGMFTGRELSKVADIREEKGEGGSRRWINAVHLRAPSGHAGYLGDLLYDGERFTELTNVELMRERVRQIAANAGSPSPIA